VQYIPLEGTALQIEAIQERVLRLDEHAILLKHKVDWSNTYHFDLVDTQDLRNYRLFRVIV